MRKGNRNIQISSGNYNEHIGGDYIQGQSVTTETYIDQDGNKVVKRTVTTNNNGKVTKTVTTEISGGTINASGAGAFSQGDIKGTVANNINVSNNSMKGSNQQIVVGDGNTVRQSSGAQMNFNGEVGNVTGIVQGNQQIVTGDGNNVVQQSGQSIMNGVTSGGDIHIGDVVQQSGADYIAKVKAEADKYMADHKDDDIFDDIWFNDNEDDKEREKAEELKAYHINTIRDVLTDVHRFLDNRPSRAELARAAADVLDVLENTYPETLCYLTANKESTRDVIPSGHRTLYDYIVKLL